MIYLDNNATTRPDPKVVDAMVRMLDTHWHNPSSVHRPGQEARQRIELARQSVARLIGAKPRDIVFTAGATESINLALRGIMMAAPAERRTIVTTRIEHEAVRDLCEALVAEMNAEIRYLPLDRDGVVQAGALVELLDETVAIVSMQWANNETGVIQPVHDIGRLCRERRIPFHSDATQWVGKMPTNVDPMDPESSPIDLMSLSAHKFHGPKGAGALYIRRGMRLAPLIRGVQERERRGGTENTSGIVGMGVAAEVAAHWLEEPAKRESIRKLRDELEQRICEQVEGAKINSGGAERLWNTTNVAFPGLEAEALLLMLSERSVCASAGAACSSGSLDPSPVLLAMGLDEPLAHGSVRFSLSRETTQDQIEDAIEIIVECANRLRASTASVIGPA